MVVMLLAEKQQEVVELRGEVGRLSELLEQSTAKSSDPKAN